MVEIMLAAAEAGVKTINLYLIMEYIIPDTQMSAETFPKGGIIVGMPNFGSIISVKALNETGIIEVMKIIFACFFLIGSFTFLPKFKIR